jgi:hypothetical protein
MSKTATFYHMTTISKCVVGAMLGVLSLASSVMGTQLGQSPVRSVRMIYLVSGDREVNPRYVNAMERAIVELQAWYGKQLGGPSFRVYSPVVEVVKSDRPASWFYANRNGLNKDDWGYNNTLEEARRLCGASHNDPKFVWVIYSDGPGNKGRGGNGVACLPEDDLLGLVGRHPTQKDKSRWVAGLGHELGHAFGLPHPSDTKKDADALMWTGIYGKYPDKAYLTDADKKLLMKSPFFYLKNGKPVIEQGKIVARYHYNGGVFERRKADNTFAWTESTTEGARVHSFEEEKTDAEYYFLNDAKRGFLIRLPINSGQSYLSTDKGKSWRPLYHVEIQTTPIVNE